MQNRPDIPINAIYPTETWEMVTWKKKRKKEGGTHDDDDDDDERSEGTIINDMRSSVRKSEQRKGGDVK